MFPLGGLRDSTISDNSLASLRVIYYLCWILSASQLTFSLDFCLVAGNCYCTLQHQCRLCSFECDIIEAGWFDLDLWSHLSCGLLLLLESVSLSSVEKSHLAGFQHHLTNLLDEVHFFSFSPLLCAGGLIHAATQTKLEARNLSWGIKTASRWHTMFRNYINKHLSDWFIFYLPGKCGNFTLSNLILYIKWFKSENKLLKLLLWLTWLT